MGSEMCIRDRFQPSDDVEADLDRIMSNYHGVQPRNPRRLSKPIRQLAERPPVPVVDRAA